MKKKSIYIIALFLIAFTFLMPTDVFAKKKKIGTCTYTVDTEKLSMTKLKSMSFTVTAYDDGSIGDKKITAKASGGKEKTYDLSSGVLIGDEYYLEKTSAFNKGKTFYKEFKKINDCPDIQLIYNVNNNLLGMYVGGGVDTNGYSSIIVSTSKTGVSGNSSSNGDKKTYCTKTNKVKATKQQMTVAFMEQNGVKTAKLTSTSGQEQILKYGGVVTVDGIIFSVDASSAKKYWSEDCNDDLPIYFRAKDGDQKTLLIQTSYPGDSNDGSYAPFESKYNDGGKSFSNKATLDGLNHEYNECSQLIDTETEGSFGWLLQKLLNYIKIAGPILVVLLSALDFIKAIASSEEDAFKKAQSRLVIRLIAALALFLVPTFVELLLGLINGINDPTCGLK